MIFDGRRFAERQTHKLGRVASEFENKHGRKAKLVTIFNPEHNPSRIYTQIKAKKAHEIGVMFEAWEIKGESEVGWVKTRIEEANLSKEVDGIMVQTPLVGEEELIELINPNKDVDGLKENSQYLQATVRAVVEIIGEQHNRIEKVAVVGSRGRIGQGLMAYFHQAGEVELVGLDSQNFELEKLAQADLVISATGVAGLIEPEMVKAGVVAIDVGYPHGDFKAEVAHKASFFTPVPGGVGPVTVVSLFANLLRV